MMKKTKRRKTLTKLERKAQPAVQKLLRKDEDQLYKELGMRRKAIAEDPYLMAGSFDFDVTYDVAVMGPMDELRKLGEQLFKRYQVEAHKLFCPKEGGDKEDIDNLKKAIGIDDAAVAAFIAAVLVTNVGIAAALAAVVAALIVKRFLRPTYEETCKAWAKNLPEV